MAIAVVAPACVDDPSTGTAALHIETGAGEFRVAGTVQAGEDHRFAIALPAGAGAVAVHMSGTGNADLYTGLDGAPDDEVYDCRSDGEGSEERCVHADHGEVIYVRVSGRAYQSTYDLDTTWGISTSP